jgi:hypothetical protein
MCPDINRDLVDVTGDLRSGFQQLDQLIEYSRTDRAILPTRLVNHTRSLPDWGRVLEVLEPGRP